MSYFITYAQNGEDIMLRRALRDVERGFYIDVGAQDPVVDSVTKALYEQGWRGINIDPVQHWYEELCKDRPHDINLQVAVSDHDGELKLFEVQDTGLSTTDRTFAWRHRAEGRNVIEYEVPAITLDRICAEHKVETVHFLKIDCEGAEKDALASISLDKLRPWIILVEATEPNSTKPTHQEWEHLLTGRGYQYVYTDGINRYYLADEHQELRPAFAWPPNIQDYAMRADEIRAHDRVGRLQHELDQALAADRVGRAEAHRDFLNRENEQREAALREHRENLAGLREQIGKLQGERAAADAHVHTLIAENKRRETALREHREAQRLLQDAVAAREAHLVQLVSERDRLIVDNDRRETALREHRENLAMSREQIGKLQGEREAAGAHVQTLIAENERRETALGQYREAQRLLQDAVTTRDAHLASLVSERDRLIVDNEQRETALRKHRENLAVSREQIGKLQGEREATLREHRENLAGLREQIGKLQGERAAADAHVHTLIAENKRRETALREHREAQRLLQDAVAAREAHLVQLVSERDHLIVDNEQREAALREHRENLAVSREQIGKLQGEREATLREHRENLAGLREQIGKLQGEREAALREYRESLVALSSERDFLAGENERRELALGRHRAALQDAQSQLQRRDAEVALLRPQSAAQAAEIARMQSEVRDMGAHIARLQAWQTAVLHSFSWRAAAPLRWAGRGARAIARFFLALIVFLLRPFARALRPVLRRMAQHQGLRRCTVAVFGKHSRFTNSARLFLFGPPPAKPVPPSPVAMPLAPPPVVHSAASAAAAEPPLPFVPQPLSVRENQVLEWLAAARARQPDVKEKAA